MHNNQQLVGKDLSKETLFAQELGALPKMTRDQLLCGETDGIPENFPTESDTVLDSLSKETIDMFKDIWNFPDLGDYPNVSLLCPEPPIGRLEKEAENKQETTAKRKTPEWKVPGNSENGRKEAKAPEKTSKKSSILLQAEEALRKSQTIILSSSSNSTEESKDSTKSSRKEEIPRYHTMPYSYMDPLGAAKPLGSHLTFQGLTGNQLVAHGLMVTEERMSSSTMISTVAGLASMTVAESWIVTAATFRSREDMPSSPTQLVFLQLTPCRGTGTISRNTENGDSSPSAAE